MFEVNDEYANNNYVEANDQFQNALRNLPNISDELVDVGAVSSYTRKLVNTTRTAEEKMNIVKQNLLNKELDIEGFQQGLLHLTDADSGEIEDPNTGQRIKIRLSDFNMYDAVDEYNVIQNKDKKSILSAQLQAKQVADLTGKSEDELTADDYKNVKNYQYQQIAGQFQNKDYQFSPYDRSTQYENLQSQPLSVAFKVTGVEKNEDGSIRRQLVEAINPVSGRQVTFDASNNPYLNSRFDVYKSIDSNYNQKRLDKYQEGSPLEKARNVIDSYDTDGVLGEWIDKVQSTLYQSYGRVVNVLPDWIPKDTEYWKIVSNAVTGKDISDLVTGVKKETRKEANELAQERQKAWDSDNMEEWIPLAIKSLPDLIADSATSFAIGAGVTTGSLALAPITGGASLAAGSIAVSSLLLASDATLSQIEEYKANNNGKSPDGETQALMFAGQLALAAPEAVLTNIGITGALGGIFKSVQSKFASTALGSRVKSTIVAALGEFGQEALQESFDQWGSQKDGFNGKDSYLDVIKKEGLQAGLLGGLMGGSLSASANLATVPFALKKENDLKKRVEAENTRSNTETVLGNIADQEKSTQIVEKITSIKPQDFSTNEEIYTTINNLSAIATSPDINEAAIDIISNKKAELIKEVIVRNKDSANLDAILQALGKTKEEVLQEQIFFSDVNTDRQVKRDGRPINEEARKQTVNELVELGAALGFNKEQVLKSIGDVDNDIKFGVGGYYNFKDQLENTIKALEDPNITPKQKEKLGSDKEGFTHRIKVLYRNQLNKLEQFAHNAERIAKGETENAKFTFTSGKGEFTLMGSHLANKDYDTDSDYGSHRMVHSIIDDLTNISNITKSLPEDVVKSIGIDSKAIDSKLQRYKDAATKVKGVVKSNIAKNTTISTNEGTQSKFSNRELLSKVSKLSKGTSDKATTILTGQLRNASKEQLDAVRKDINRIANEKTKTSLLNTLDTIQKLEDTTNKEQKDLQTRTESNRNKLEVFKKEVSDEAITKLDTVEKLTKKLDEVKNLVSPIAGSLAKDDELLLFYRERYRKIRDIRDGLLVKEQQEKATITKIGTEPTVSSKNISETARDNSTLQPEIKESGVPVVESKGSALLLDPTINNSATFTPEGWGEDFNLSNELSLSEDPSSRIATEGAEQSYVNEILNKMKPLFLTLKKKMSRDGKEENIISQLAAFTRGPNSEGIMETGGMWKDSPHLRLLYNFIINGKNIVFKPNENVVAAIDLSLKEFFSTVDTKDIFNPTSKYDLATMYGYNPETITDEELNQLKDVVKKHGILKEVIAQRLGNLILDNLGLRENHSKGTYGFYERVSAGLGMFAISYAETLGYVTESVFDSKKWSENYKEETGLNKTHAIKYNTPHIKFNRNIMGSILNEYLGTERDENNERINGLKDKYILTERTVNKPRTAREDTLPKDMYIQGTNRLSKIPRFVKGIIQKLWNTPYEINLELAELVAKNKDAILSRLGYISNPESLGLSLDALNSAEGVNLSVSEQVRYLLEHAARQKKFGHSWFFNWFMSKNGRLFMESATLNPQAGKTLQRFLVLPKSMYRDFDPNDKNHLALMYFAIAQAFDSLGTDESIEMLGNAVQNMTLEELNTLQSDVINLNEKAFEHKYKEFFTVDGKTFGLKGIENFGQVLNVIQHLQKMKQAEGKVFKTWLAVENDSTTSGYILRMMQFPDPTIRKNFAEKVGILTIDKDGESILPQIEIHGLKKLPSFQDIYKTIAKVAVKSLPDINNEHSYIDDVLTNFMDSKYDHTILTNLYETMYDALPNLDEKGDVSSALRKLFKSPTMVFGYTAGEKAISRKLSGDILVEFVNTYMEIKNVGDLNKYLTSIGKISDLDKSRISSIYNTMESINKLHKGNLYQTLKQRSTAEIFLKVGDRVTTLTTLFNEVLAPTYGKAAWTALDNSFSGFNPYNETINAMFTHMFQMFDKELNKKMEMLKKEYPKGIPTVKRDEAVKSLFELYPALRLAYSNMTEEGMLLMSTDKDRTTKEYSVLSPINDNGFTKRTTSYANVRKFVNAGKAGAVLPIHFIDGMLMALVLSKYPRVVPVHDAIVMSAPDNVAITKEYHEAMYTLNNSFNMYEELVKRYTEVLSSYEKRNNKDFYKEQLIDAYGNEVFKDKLPYTVNDLIKDVIKLKDSNNTNRDTFYKNSTIFLSNMDGAKDSAYIGRGQTLSDKIFLDALEESNMYSDPHEYQTDNGVSVLLQDASTSMEGRVALFDSLQVLAKQLGNKLENITHLQHLKTLLKKVNPKYLQDLVIEYNTSQPYNVGKLQGNTITIGFDNKTDSNLDRVTKLSPFSGKSAAEIYAHEVIHAGLRVGFANKDAFKLNKEIQQLLNLQRSAMDIVTWQDFMPDNYDSALESMYEDKAKQLWEYIFNNDKTTQLQGLHEFATYGLTNEKMMNKLKEHYVIEASTKTRLLDKLIALAKHILDIVYGKTSISTLLNTVSSNQRLTLFDELTRLTTKINYANTEATNQWLGHPLRLTERLFALVSKGIQKGNNYVSPYLHKLLNIVDTLGYTKGLYISPDITLFDKSKLFFNVFALTPLSDSRRKAVKSWLQDSLQLSQQGTVQTILREFQEPDLQSSRLAMITALTKMVEQSSKSLESNMFTELVERFGKKNAADFTIEETTALTEAVLRTDLQSLLDDNTSIDSIKELLNNSNKLIDSIKILENKLNKNKNGTYYINQAYGLARFMITGKGNEIQNLNATNIAEGRMTGKVLDTTEELIKDIDKLTTLYALRRTDLSHKQVASTFNSIGLQHYLNAHKEFVKSTEEGVIINNKVVKTVNNIHSIKGYVKQLFDSSLDSKIDLTKNTLELTKQGYKKVMPLSTNKITGESELALYVRNFAPSQRRDGSSFILTGTNTVGTTLRESARNMYSRINSDNNPDEIRGLHEVYYKRAQQTSNKLLHMMETRLITDEDINKVSKGYTPIVSPNGGIADFRITMLNSNKVEHLGMNQNGFTILSKMYASQNTKLNASSRNQILTNFLKNGMENMNLSSKEDLEGHRYILMEEKSSNKFLQEAWKIIPKELMSEIKKGDFYIREDWLQELFGVPSISVTELKPIKESNAITTKRILSIAEYLLKTVAYKEKQNIILRLPIVLIGNIISNMNYAIMTGTNPATVLKKTVDNAKSIKDYMDTKKELNRVLIRKRLGTATQFELKQINWFNSKLQANPVHVLMEKGMYQAIVEDIRTEDLESIGKVSKFIKETKLLKKVPKFIQEIGRQLYMTEGTPIYDFMFTVTQYSDFVARATQYQLRMAKAPTKYETIKQEDGKEIKRLTDAYIKYEEKVTIEVWNAFINYDKPQSSLVQYLNDIGLLMFTKYAFRIQHIVTKGILDNPIGTLLFLISQSTIVNTEDIMEQNIVNKHWLSLWHNPFTNLINAATPMPIQFYTGMRNLGI